MEEKKNNNGVHVSDTPNAEMTTDRAVQNPEEMTKLDALKAENENLKRQLKDAKDSFNFVNKRWGELLRDVENYKSLIRVMMEELKWDDATAIGKASVAGGLDIFEFIERQH